MLPEWIENPLFVSKGLKILRSGTREFQKDSISGLDEVFKSQKLSNLKVLSFLLRSILKKCAKRLMNAE